jgi:putative exosortase-associated protein (TIGR04073 family)
MKTALFILCLTAVILFNFTQSLNAELNNEDTRLGGTPLHKLERGVVNIFTSPVELPASMISVAKEKGEIFGFFIGTAEGLFTFVFRLISGVYDTATFFIPSYSIPIMQPEYATQSLENALR